MNIKNIISKATNILLVLFVCFTVFPVKLNYSSIVIIALCLVSLINFYYERLKSIPKRYLFLVSIPFFVYLFGLINTSNLNDGISFVTRNLSFLAFPLVFFSLGDKVKQKIVLNSFLLSLLVVNIYLIYLFFYYFNFGERFYKIVTVDIYHSTYLGLYNLFAYWIGIYYYRRKRQIGYVLLSLVFLIAAIATSARIIFILGFLSLVATALLLLKSPSAKVLVVVFFGLISFFVLDRTPSIKQKFSQIWEVEQIGFDKRNYRSISSRFGNIEASVEVLKKYPLFGTGTGDMIDELVVEYKKMNFTMGYKNRYNPHNQYLDNLIRNGIFGGGICILTIYIIPLIVGIRKRDLLLSTFIFLILGVSLTESILDVHKGITFYAFFMTFLLRGCDFDFWNKKAQSNS